MKAEDLLEMAKGFEEIIKAVKSGEVTIKEVKDGLDEALVAVDTAMEMAQKIFTGEEVEGIGSIQRQIIIDQANEAMVDFDKAKHSKIIVDVLNMCDKIDTELGEEVVLPYMMTILEKTLPFVETQHKDGTQSMKDGIMSFYENRTNA